MPALRQFRRLAGPRDLLYFGQPDLWPLRPFLPVMRYPVEGPREYGVLYDAVHASGTYGYSSTVWFTNLFDLPATEAEFLALPHHCYDNPEELASDGWVID